MYNIFLYRLQKDKYGCYYLNSLADRSEPRCPLKEGNNISNLDIK